MARANFWARRLGRELAGLRDLAGLTQAAVAPFVDLTQPRITQIERGTGKSIVRLGDLRALAAHYGATGATTDRLIRLWQNAKRNGWWSTYGLPDWMADYLSLEADAVTIREAQLELVPGLLQTPDYARALHHLRGMFGEEEIARRVDTRMQRQQRLTGPDPLRFSTVMSEAALHRCRGCGVMGRAQLAQLAERAQWPNVELLVLPFDAGLHGSMRGAFTLLEFPEGLLPPMVYQEYPVAGHLIELKDAVEQMLTLYDSELRGQALGADDSLALLAESA